ncbi:MAG: hypothetical protein KGL39_22440, partial [Patescibacteria group bacterium]|nr:hypothetical protein [Patescibacteria group bacterium]
RTRKANSGEPPAPPASPAAPTGADLMRRVQALGIGREQDFLRRVHELRAGHQPGVWNDRQRLALETVLAVWEAKPK